MNPDETPKQARVLVIDDDPTISELIQLALVSGGHEVVVSNSGKEGVERATEDHFDLIFSDLGMPDLSGWEVARRILGVKPDQPFIFVTGWGSTLEEQKLADYGVQAVIQKPFEFQELLTVTKRVLEDV